MANGKRVDLLVNAAAGNGADKRWLGGKGAFMAEATFGAGNVKLQIKLPQGTYADVATTTLTAAGMAVVDLPPGIYRGVVGAGASAAYASLVKIDE